VAPAGADADQVWAAIDELSCEDKETLRTWMEIGRRPIDSTETLFADVRALTPQERDGIADSLRL